MFVVTVLFKIHAAHWEAFTAAMHQNAQTSLAIEPACRQFDVCEGAPGQSTVFLYELYDTQADFTAHLGAPHFLQFNAETAAWVADKEVQTFTRTTAATMTSTHWKQHNMTGAQTPLKLGCIADDFTGATDLANNLVRAGMRVVQTIGTPDASDTVDADAVVVALKSRTLPAAQAVAQSLAALRWLQAQGAQQVYFKYCSTFDSVYEGDTRGNIGPVTEALMDALGADFTVATPAFPDNQRTVFKGHLFVGEALLAESGMRNHPLTPMTDSNLVRVMQGQCRRKVGLLDYSVVARGADAIAERVAQLRAQGVGIAIVDAVSNADLLVLGRALAGLPLLTAGSGLAIGLPANFSITPSVDASVLPPARGATAIVSGSCSVATNAQVKHFMDAGLPAFAVDPVQLARGVNVVQQVMDWATPWLGQKPVLVYSTADPTAVKTAQAQLGVQAAGDTVEKALSEIARGLVKRGVGQLIVAGGETSGACVQALGITRMQVGMQVAPGVPWCHAETGLDGMPVHLLLKSGNFGAPDIFTQAFGLLV